MVHKIGTRTVFLVASVANLSETPLIILLKLKCPSVEIVDQRNQILLRQKVPILENPGRDLEA